MSHIPVVTKEEMVELDRRMIEEYGIPLEIMMENAGKSLAELTRRLFSYTQRIIVLVGPGNNGGGGVAAARHLINWGKDVTILLSEWRQDVSGMLKEQLGVLENVGVEVMESPELGDDSVKQICERSGVLLDALLGYSIDGDPRGEIERLIEIANNSQKPILSLDLPSGLSPNDGVVYKPIINATATMTLAAVKRGLQTAEAEKHVGDLYLADISVPFPWYQEHAITNSPFEADFIIKI